MKHVILGLVLGVMVIVAGCAKQEEAPKAPEVPAAPTTNAPAAP